ncbi:putative sodium/potassium/calcium exchanger [Natrinema salaciae]|uniref:Uncharacterized protein n=1 Tax=Natrinema salaciae TaxID=1186196 RepID=A0A1H9MNB5_9EURY|nr:hypothetical protein [Natrinema salaciae]SER25200.1 hypothetical protein SAMN04489841_3430 [Natrinema salaciae]
MQARTLAVVAVALLVAFSGCSALGGSQADTPSDETDENDTGGQTEDLGDGDDPNGTEDGSDTEPGNETDGGDGTTDNTADAEWYPPEEPNRPLERKDEERIENVSFVDKELAENGEGYSNFNLEVVANTSMENVDPPEHGDVIGEPYFFVKINEGPGERKIVERTREVRMEENGTFHIDVRPAGIEEFGSGPLTVEVFLMDEDKDWDDVYDAVGQTIEFNPETGEDTNDSETDGDTNDSETGEDTDDPETGDTGAENKSETGETNESDSIEN